MAVSYGLADYVLIPAGYRTYSGGAIFETYGSQMGSGDIVHTFYDSFGAFGAVPQYALVANYYLETYGITAKQTGAVAVTMRRHAQLNTAALMHGRPMTIEDYLGSPMISTPFRLLDCALPNDGAAAVVVTTVERARDLPGPRVEILGVAESRPYPVDDLANRKDLLQIGVGPAARAAFSMAEHTPRDMDFMQLYDSFTTNVLRQIEELGICERGEAGHFVEDGNIAIGGALPANTDGGMLSGGSTQGMSQLIEGVRQLRGSATGRQIPDAELGVVVGMGGGWGTAAVAVLGAAR
jgi:acetyl-CoA acetyltransferase